MLLTGTTRTATTQGATMSLLYVLLVIFVICAIVVLVRRH